MQSSALAVVNPSVCHTLVLCQNEASYDHVVFIRGQPHDLYYQRWSMTTIICRYSKTT